MSEALAAAAEPMALVPFEERDGAFLLDPEEIFPAAKGEPVRNLLADYAATRAGIEAIAAFVHGAEHREALTMFLRGNAERGDHRVSAETLFTLAPALKALDAEYWSRALALTDVFQVMNEDRRTKWTQQFESHDVPEFTADNLSATLGDLLASRERFFAERVDGLFRNLSGEHVTNSPRGFGVRMILAGAWNGWHADSRRVGYISDLRAVVAKFMGREEPSWSTTSALVEFGVRQQRGQWVEVDGGSFRLRCYQKGTAHIEIHPEMAWRLNAVLASLYPRAIAADARAKPSKPVRGWRPIQRPLPARVLSVLNQVRPSSSRDPHQFTLTSYSEDRAVVDEAKRVLECLGAVVRGDEVTFDYPARPVIEEVVASGCIPDAKSHQYYPTPAPVAEIVMAMAEIHSGHVVLEPSAGQGGLVERCPHPRNVTSIELSSLHALVLRQKGLDVTIADFLAWRSAMRFDRVVMNPPFSEGRWRLHVEHASLFVREGGRLVAVLPASARGKDLLPGWATRWSEVLTGEFDGTGVSVVVMAADKPTGWRGAGQSANQTGPV